MSSAYFFNFYFFRLLQPGIDFFSLHLRSECISTNLLFFSIKSQILVRHLNNGGAPAQFFDSICFDIPIVEPKKVICFKQNKNNENSIS